MSYSAAHGLGARGDMELICYLHPGWAPLIRPAPASRAWMDATSESFARRCLPLNIANAHGWEVLSPCGFEAVWNGDAAADGVSIRLDEGSIPRQAPIALFGQGVVTFHIEGIFRTPAGWNLWIGPSPNRQKDAIQALTGVIETDWSPFTFTMNWRFTRPHTPVRFEAGEPIGFFFPVQRAALEGFEPEFQPLDGDPELMRRFMEWSQSRDAFHQAVSDNPPTSPADRWQKHYYRGVDASGEALVADHQSKLRLRAFDRRRAPEVPRTSASDPPERPASAVTPGPAADGAAAAALRKRDWLLETVERQRSLVPAAAAIERRADLSGEAFLEHYYAANRPVILTGEMADWPALERWTPEYLAETVGDRVIEYQGGRSANPRFEQDKDVHRREAPFDEYMQMISQPGAGNDAYITAYNSARNTQALGVLNKDLGHLDKFLTRQAGGMVWIGPAGTTTSLHHDLTNNLIAQVRGRKRLKIVPAAEVGRLYNHRHVFSEIADLDDPALDLARFERLAGARVYDVLLEPGEIIFMPIGWWHQVKALEFSVTITYTNFLWPNDAHLTYPGD